MFVYINVAYVIWLHVHTSTCYHAV